MVYRLSQRDTMAKSFEYRLYPPTAYLRANVPTGLINSSGASTVQSAAAVANATPHTKATSWTPLIASTTADIHLLTLETSQSTQAPGADSSTLIDVGIGAAASETAIIPNIPFGYLGASGRYEIPVYIPAGSRISLRSQSVTGSKSVTIYARGFTLPNSLIPATYVINYGADTATSHGVSLGAAGATNTKTSWTIITSATTERLMAIAVGIQGNAQTTMANAGFLLDIGLGSTEVVIPAAADMGGLGNSTEGYQFLATPTLCPVDIPEGTRISARYQTANTSNQIDVVVLGIPWRHG
jgi:hypothetical protein